MLRSEARVVNDCGRCDEELETDERVMKAVYIEI